MHFRSWFILFVFLVSPHLVFAISSVELTINRNSFYQNEQAILTLSITNGSGRESLQVPELKDIEITSYGTSQQTSYINGKRSHIVQYSYRMYSQKTGKFRLPPFVVMDGTKKFESNSIIINVLDPKKSGNMSKSSAGRKKQKPLVSDKDLHIDLKLDKESLYVNEGSVLTFRLVMNPRLKLRRNMEYDPPKLSGFIHEPLGEQESHKENINGQICEVVEINSLVYPTKSGELEIGPAKISAEFLKRNQNRRQRGHSVFGMDSFFNDPFFGGNYEAVPITIESNILKINVKPLPKKNKPKDFRGSVGVYDLKVDISQKDNIKTGDALTFTMIISGKGNIASVAEPIIQENPSFKFFDDTDVKIQPFKHSPIGGQKILKKVLIPLEAGRIKIPKVTFSYFDPSLGEYKTIVKGGQFINVTKAKENQNAGQYLSVQKNPTQTSPSTEKSNNKIKKLGQDIIYIETNSELLEEGFTEISMGRFILLLWLIPLLSLSLVFQRQKAALMQSDPLKSKQQKAYKQFQQNIKSLPSYEKNSYEAFQSLNQVINIYMGSKLLRSETAISSSTFEEVLKSRGQESTDLEKRFRELYEAIEQAQFGLGSYSANDFKSMTQDVARILKELEKVL